MHFRSYQPRRTLRETITITTRPRKDYQQEENYLPSYQRGGILCKVINRTVVSQRRKKPIKIEFEKFPNSDSPSKVKCAPAQVFQPNHWYGSMVWINEVDTARNMDELKSSIRYWDACYQTSRYLIQKLRLPSRSC